jgi:hypothetical protein
MGDMVSISKNVVEKNIKETEHLVDLRLNGKKTNR